MLNFLLNILILFISIWVIYIYSRRAAIHYKMVLGLLAHENEFYTELILGLEAAGKSVCQPTMIKREIRLAIWEFYNNLWVQPDKGNKIVVMQRKMLDKRLPLYQNFELGKVNMEILPFLGILGTLLGFAIPYIFNVAQATKLTFNVSGLAFFMAATSTICALIGLIYLKKKYEAVLLAQFDYFQSQEKALERIMIEGDGFKILELWLKKWPEPLVEKEKALSSPPFMD